MDLYTGSISKNTLVSTIYSLTNKGFQVLLTKNSKETAFFILQFAEKMERTNKVIEENVTYENTPSIVQTKKNKNINKDNISVFMLCQIPGISTTTAGILLEKYGHITNLIISMKNNSNEMEEFRNNNKKLNKNIIKNLNIYLECQ
jgi:ERCC4-type nuclease